MIFILITNLSIKFIDCCWKNTDYSIINDDNNDDDNEDDYDEDDSIDYDYDGNILCKS